MKSFDHWKATNPDDEWLGNCPQSGDRLEEDEALAAMLNVTLDEYIANKVLDRYLSRTPLDETDELPF